MTALQQRQEALTSANKTVLIVAWYKDAGGTLGYLETRRDIDWSRFPAFVPKADGRSTPLNDCHFHS
jgi:hypothetical protein